MKHYIVYILMSQFYLFLLSSCHNEKYPEGFYNELPFRLKYEMPKEQIYSTIDSLAGKGEILDWSQCRNKFLYKFYSKARNADITLSIELSFRENKLYCLEIANTESFYRNDSERNFETAMDFMIDQEINFNSYYERTKGVYFGREFHRKEEPYKIVIDTKYDGGIRLEFYNDGLKDLPKSSNKNKRIYKTNDEFCSMITDPEMGVCRATVTDASFLVIGIRPVGNPDFDYLAQSYFEQALDAGLQIKGCYIVNINDSKWQDGAVIGKRIGKYYK